MSWISRPDASERDVVLKDTSDLREIGDAHDALLAAQKRLDEAIEAARANGRSEAEISSRLATFP